MRRDSGFTLLELSIVVLIIGALAGSILLGESLIRASKIRSMLSEYDTYIKAVGEFQDKFQALPGDMKGVTGFQPTDMWGSDGCGCTCTSSTTKTMATCNGDGDGKIGSSSATGVIDTGRYEWFRAWQHLANAGFIKGVYSGSAGGTGSAEIIGPSVNVPESAIGGAGWTLQYVAMVPNAGYPETDYLWHDNYNHMLWLGAGRNNAYNWAPFLTPSEMLSIDTKMDDALPGLGKLRAIRSASQPNCTTNDNTTQAAQTYNVSYTSIACSLAFITGF